MRGRHILDACFLAPKSHLEIEAIQRKYFILPDPFLPVVYFCCNFFIIFLIFPTSQTVTLNLHSIGVTLQSYATYSETLWVVPEMSPYLAKNKMDEMVPVKILDRRDMLRSDLMIVAPSAWAQTFDQSDEET